MNSVVLGLYTIPLVLLFVMMKQGLSRKVDFFSARNMYLVSFIIYQLYSPAVALDTENFLLFRVNFPIQTGKTFFLMASTYLVVFFISYQRIGFTPWIARKCTFPPREVNDFLLLGLAIFLVVAGMVLRFVPLPFALAATAQIAIAFASIASAITGWVWSNRRTNIPVVLVAALVVSASLMIALTGVFGRRPLLAVVMGFAWGVYHRRARLMSPAKMVLYIAPFLLAAAAIVAAYTAVRSHDLNKRMDFQGTVRDIGRANIWEGFRNLVAGQSTGAACLWAIEQWPERFETRYFHSLKYMVMWYIPRAIWPDKPEPLGNDVAKLADIEGVNQEAITLPPGVIGYAAAEGGYWAVIAYAIFFGQFLRLIDELVRLNPTNSFIILPAAVATGQAFGLARGCIALFTDLIVLGFGSTYIILFITDRLFGQKLKEPQQQSQITPWPQYRQPV